MAQQGNLQIPSTEIIEFRIEDNLEYGKFYFAGLRKGQGITVANALRRVLLYDIQGIGITSLQFYKNLKESEGPSSEPILYNEFSSIPRFRESVLEIGINISSIVCRLVLVEPEITQESQVKVLSKKMDIEAQREKFSKTESLSEVGLEEAQLPNAYLSFFLNNRQSALIEKRLFCLEKMFSYFLSSDDEFFQLKESRIFTLRAKHIFDPKFCTVSRQKSDSIENKMQLNQKTVPLPPTIVTASQGGKETNSLHFDSASKSWMTIKNPDHEVASIFVSYDPKTGFEYPDLKIEYTIGTLDHIQFRNQQMGENPGGIQIGGSNPNLLLAFVDNSNDLVSGQNYKNWFTCSNETNFFPVKKVNYTVQEKNFEEEVFLEIWTNGSLSPKEVLSQALALLINLFKNLSI